ncbi:MAG: hypothetical protein V2J12_05420, partial [Gammaproteobacteria bacterium]|nr:hypothetical protein [Gammaproteobacteria bacterium]
PVGDRGVRVFVVVAKSVSVGAPRGGGFLLLSYGSSYCWLFFFFSLTSGFDVWLQNSKVFGVTETFFCAH